MTGCCVCDEFEHRSAEVGRDAGINACLVYCAVWHVAEGCRDVGRGNGEGYVPDVRPVE